MYNILFHTLHNGSIPCIMHWFPYSSIPVPQWFNSLLCNMISLQLYCTCVSCSTQSLYTVPYTLLHNGSTCTVYPVPHIAQWIHTLHRELIPIYTCTTVILYPIHCTTILHAYPVLEVAQWIYTLHYALIHLLYHNDPTCILNPVHTDVQLCFPYCISCTMDCHNDSIMPIAQPVPCIAIAVLYPVSGPHEGKKKP